MQLGIGGHQRGFEGRTNVWLTPPEVLKALGTFDLDPCAAPDPQPWPTAATMWTERGLSREWFGRVWLNPPYGPHTAEWIDRLKQHRNGIALTFARTETSMFFEHVWRGADAMLFLEGRLHFHHADGTRAQANSGGPSVLIAYGEQNAKSLRDCGLPGAFVSGWRMIAEKQQEAGLFAAA